MRALRRMGEGLEELADVALGIDCVRFLHHDLGEHPNIRERLVFGGEDLIRICLPWERTLGSMKGEVGRNVS
jgi:hypothetical protein